MKMLSTFGAEGCRRARDLVRDTKGQGTTEYAILVGVLVGVVVLAFHGRGRVGQGQTSAVATGSGDAGPQAGSEPDANPSGGADATGDEGAIGLSTEGLTESSQDGVSVQVVPGEVEQVATRLLSSYRDTGGCVLAYSGYIDLTGSVWACTVQGDGWVDVCVIGNLDDGSCELSVLRMDRDEMWELLADQDAPPGGETGDGSAEGDEAGQGG